VSNIILDISDRLENDHHIYDMIDDRLKHYLSKINLKNNF
jgi:ubiquinone biosynthesis protein COQ9